MGGFTTGAGNKHLITLRGVVPSDRLSGAYDPADITEGMAIVHSNAQAW
jgi:hypothetical protein